MTFSTPIYAITLSDDTGVAMGAAAVHDLIAIQAPCDTGSGRKDQAATDLRIREIRIGEYSDPPAAGAEEILGLRIMRFVNPDTGVSFLDTGTNNKRVYARPLNSRFGFDTGGVNAIRAVAMADTGNTSLSHVKDTGYTVSAWKNTNKRSNGTSRRETLIADAWNIAAPWWYYPPEEECPILRSGDVLVVRCSKPADVLTVNGTIIVERIGTARNR